MTPDQTEALAAFAVAAFAVAYILFDFWWREANESDL